MNLTIKSTVTTEREIEIPLPAFYKDCKCTGISEYVAILAEETMIEVWQSERRTAVTNKTTEGQDNDIARIHNSYDLCTETEFFEAFDKAYASLPVPKPRLEYYANGMINATI